MFIPVTFSCDHVAYADDLFGDDDDSKTATKTDDGWSTDGVDSGSKSNSSDNDWSSAEDDTSTHRHKTDMTMMPQNIRRDPVPPVANSNCDLSGQSNCLPNMRSDVPVQSVPQYVPHHVYDNSGCYNNRDGRCDHVEGNSL